MRKILNITQHNATIEQVNDGVIEPEEKSIISQLLTFESIPDLKEIRNRSQKIKEIVDCYDVDAVMIGGAPFLMSELEKSLEHYEILYAFSKRVSEEKIVDGNLIKTNVFKHIGFVRK